MGIKGLFQWVRAEHPDCVEYWECVRSYDFVYIDFSQVLHRVVTIERNLNEFLKLVFICLDRIMAYFIPIRGFMIAMDGISPKIKRRTQKKRREIILRNEGLVSKEEASSVSPQEERQRVKDYVKIKEEKDEVSRLMFYPNGKLAKIIDKRVYEYIEEKKKLFKYHCPQFSYSPGMEPGEGEIKILKKIRENQILSVNATHVIVGNDSDILVMSMLNCMGDKIDIMTKNPEIIRVNRLLEDVIPSMQSLSSADRRDLVFVTLMLGNDYLPKLPFVTQTKLMKSYKEFRKDGNGTITNDNYDIDFSNLRDFFVKLVLNLNKGFRKSNIGELDFASVSGYFSELMWCIKMYEGQIDCFKRPEFSSHCPSPLTILISLDIEIANEPE